MTLAHPGLARLFGGAYETDVAEGGVSRAVGRLRDKPAESWSEGLYQVLLPEIAYLPAKLQRSWRFYNLFPNTLLMLQPEQVIAVQVLPLGPEETLIRSRRYGLPQADRRLTAVRYLADRIHRQVAAENRKILPRVQFGLGSDRVSATALGDTEIAVQQFHAMLRRLLSDEDEVTDPR